MTAPENPLAKLVPGDLSKMAGTVLPAAIPAAMPIIQKALPGGFRNRIVQWGLGVLVAFGLSFVVRRMLEKREAKKRALAPPPAPRPIAPPHREALAAAPQGAAAATAAIPANTGLAYPMLGRPHISLAGPVDQLMYASFSQQLALAPADGPLVVAISTLGGDPEVARLMGDEIRLLRDYHRRDMVFLGKVSVYSAGTVLMAAFPADRRYLTRGSRLLIHERVMSFGLSGSLRSLTETMRSHLGEVEHALKVEEESFRDLVAGTSLTIEELRQRAPSDWYIDAEQARELRLIADVI